MTESTPKRGGVPPSDWRDRFLAHLAKYANVSKAAEAAGVSRNFVYTRRKEDADFAAAWIDALDEGADGLEMEAHRRAVTGVLKPIYQAGKKVGTVREFSDTLLIFLLKGARPEKYRENVRTVSAQVMYTPEQLASMSDEELAEAGRKLGLG